MSTLTVLKEYLIGKDDDIGYLLNPEHNGKTVMLSGAWGSGKTHFWLKDIKPQLTDKKQKNIYISLYGRESIHELKFEVLKEAYNLEVKKDIISKSASMLSTIAPSFGEKSLVDGFDKLNKKAKTKKSEEVLKSGSIICLDDFERKSTKIDLNDLFGYISQLALDYNCKVVIILNSDAFEGEEANVFKTVKEKTVNKFFYFEPTMEELFERIYESNPKYTRLDEYKENILNAIKKTEELNARIYIQILDNCFEWIDRGYENKFLDVLIYSTTSFVLSNLVLTYPNRDSTRHPMSTETYIKVSYKELDTYHSVLQERFPQPQSELPNETKTYTFTLEKIQKRLRGKTKQGTFIFSDTDREVIEKELNDNKSYLQTLWKYGYQLYYFTDIEEESYKVVSDFVKTGILPLRVKS